MSCSTRPTHQSADAAELVAANVPPPEKRPEMLPLREGGGRVGTATRFETATPRRSFDVEVAIIHPR